MGVEGSSHQLLRLFEDFDLERVGQLSWPAFRALAHQLPELAHLADDADAVAAFRESSASSRARSPLKPHAPLTYPPHYPPHSPPHFPPRYHSAPLAAAHAARAV